MLSRNRTNFFFLFVRKNTKTGTKIKRTSLIYPAGVAELAEERRAERAAADADAHAVAAIVRREKRARPKRRRGQR